MRTDTLRQIAQTAEPRIDGGAAGSDGSLASLPPGAGRSYSACFSSATAASATAARVLAQLALALSTVAQAMAS